MPQSPGSSSSTGSPEVANDFGANEWLVEEMFDQFQKDPSSVDPAWAAFFKAQGNGAGNGTGNAAGNGSGSAASSNGSSSAAAPAKAPAAKAEPAKPAPKAAAPAEAAKAPAPVAKPRPESKAAEVSKGTSSPMPKETKPAAKAEASDEPTYTVLRGAPARTAQNMDVSLTVPTATSIRSVPVKLLWDNRTVINNHLARARGGKVSFTHLIGYALVKALKSMPEMNNAYAEVDGKPNLVTPAHINLGLAIDIKKGDTRQLLVPSIKACETMDFAGFWTAYEDLIRKARDNKLTMDD